MKRQIRMMLASQRRSPQRAVSDAQQHGNMMGSKYQWSSFISLAKKHEAVRNIGPCSVASSYGTDHVVGNFRTDAVQGCELDKPITDTPKQRILFLLDIKIMQPH